MKVCYSLKHYISHMLVRGIHCMHTSMVLSNDNHTL
jgi:hypothetical protein